MNDVQHQVLLTLDSVLSLRGRGLQFTAETALLGALPELDSFAAAAVLGALEDQFGIGFADEALTADAFATVGGLTRLVAAHLHPDTEPASAAAQHYP